MHHLMSRYCVKQRLKRTNRKGGRLYKTMHPVPGWFGGSFNSSLPHVHSPEYLGPVLINAHFYSMPNLTSTTSPPSSWMLPGLPYILHWFSLLATLSLGFFLGSFLSSSTNETKNHKSEPQFSRGPFFIVQEKSLISDTIDKEGNQ